jgi:hypothetical protein
MLYDLDCSYYIWYIRFAMYWASRSGKERSLNWKDLYYMRGKGDSPHQAGVFTQGEGSRSFVLATKWLNKM